jgi:hypothetical protein
MKKLLFANSPAPNKRKWADGIFIGNRIRRATCCHLVPIWLLLGLFLCNTSVITAQVIPGTAPVNIPAGGFHIEGNLQANTPTGGIGDWLPGLAGAGGNVLNAGGVPLIAATTFHLTDLYNQNENNFSGNIKKFNANPTLWKWTNSPVLGKCDINNALFHFTTSGTGANTHTWLIVAADRLSNSGNAYIDFELLQNTLTDNPDGSFSSAGPNNGRTKGDYLITLSLTGGGGTTEFFVNRWDNPTGTYDYVDRTSLIPANSVFGSTNATTVPVSFGAFGLTEYAPNLFVEAAIDLTALLGAIDPCTSLGVKTLFIKTKTSQSPTATIVDFISAKQVSLQIGVANAGQDISQCGSVFSVSGTAIPSPGDAVTSTNWSIISGSATITSPSLATSNVTVTSSSATLRFTVNTSYGCVTTDDVILTILPPPTVSAGSPFTKTCVSNTSGGTIGETAVSGFTYSWVSSPTGFTSTASNPNVNPTVTTTYTVTKTNTLTGCFNTATVTVTVDNDAVTLSAGSPFTKTCLANTSGAAIGETAVSGYTYSWSPAAGLSATNVSNPTANPLVTTTYTVTKTKTSSGCFNTATVTVTVDNATVSVSAGSPFTKTCVANTSGAAIGETAVSGYTYSWSPAAGLSATNVSNPTANPLVTTTYTVTKTKTSSGCQNTASVTITVDNTPPAAPTFCAVEPSLCGSSTGSITILTPTGPAGTYEYSIKNGDALSWQPSTLFSPLAAGSVTGIRVKNMSSGCVSLAATCSESTCPVPPGLKSTPMTEKVTDAKATTIAASSKGVETININLASKTLASAGPNPFSDKLRFAIQSGVSGRCSLELYNMMGQKVNTVFEGFMEAGKNRNIEYNVPVSQRTNLMWVFTVGDQKVSGKLVGIK